MFWVGKNVDTLILVWWWVCETVWDKLWWVIALSGTESWDIFSTLSKRAAWELALILQTPMCNLQYVTALITWCLLQLPPAPPLQPRPPVMWHAAVTARGTTVLMEGSASPLKSCQAAQSFSAGMTCTVGYNTDFDSSFHLTEYVLMQSLLWFGVSSICWVMPTECNFGVKCWETKLKIYLTKLPITIRVLL